MNNISSLIPSLLMSSIAQHSDSSIELKHKADQFIESLEEFLTLTSRILARQVLRIEITIEHSQNIKHCAKFTINDDTKKHASFSLPMFDNISYLLNKHSNDILSPMSGLATYLLQAFDETQTKNAKMVFCYKKGLLHSVDATFSKIQEKSWERILILIKFLVQRNAS